MSDPSGYLPANEPVFRAINESIERGYWPGDGAPAQFRCECSRLGCAQMIKVAIGEYEGVRAHPRRFVIAVGHELAEIETVIERRDGYLVVEKRGDAGELAEATNPRASEAP